MEFGFRLVWVDVFLMAKSYFLAIYIFAGL